MRSSASNKAGEKVVERRAKAPCSPGSAPTIYCFIGGIVQEGGRDVK